MRFYYFAIVFAFFSCSFEGFDRSFLDKKDSKNTYSLTGSQQPSYTHVLANSPYDQTISSRALNDNDSIVCEPGVVIKTSPRRPAFLIEGKANVSIEGCTFEQDLDRHGDVPPSGVILIRAGTNVTLKDLGFRGIGGRSAIMVEGKSPDWEDLEDSDNNLRIDGITFDGPTEFDKPKRGKGNEAAILLRNTSHVEIKNGRFRDVRGKSAVEIVDSEHVRVSRVKVRHYSFAGISVLGESYKVEVRNSEVHDADPDTKEDRITFGIAYGFTVSSNHGKYPDDVLFNGNLCQNNLHWDCYDAHGGTNLTFSYNRAIESLKCFDVNLKVFNPQQNHLSDIKLIGNTCEHTPRNEGTIKIKDPDDDTKWLKDANGEFVYVRNSQGILVSGALNRRGQRVFIYGNKISSSGTGVRPNRAAVHVVDVDDLRIQNNEIKNYPHTAVSVEARVSQYSLIGNTIENVAGFGIYVGNDVEGLRANSGNSVDGVGPGFSEIRMP